MVKRHIRPATGGWYRIGKAAESRHREAGSPFEPRLLSLEHLRLFFKFENCGYPFPIAKTGIVRLHFLLPIRYGMRRVVSPVSMRFPQFV